MKSDLKKNIAYPSKHPEDEQDIARNM